MGGRKNRNGVFPASSCIKMTGYYSECDTLIVVYKGHREIISTYRTKLFRKVYFCKCVLSKTRMLF